MIGVCEREPLYYAQLFFAQLVQWTNLNSNKAAPYNGYSLENKAFAITCFGKEYKIPELVDNPTYRFDLIGFGETGWGPRTSTTIEEGYSNGCYELGLKLRVPSFSGI